MVFWLRTHFKACLLVYECLNGLCLASMLPNPPCGELAYAVPVFDVPLCAYWSLIAVYCLTCLCGCLAVLAVKLGVGFSVPTLLHEYLHCCAEGFQSSVWWCSWLLLPMISRLACPASWVGLAKGLFRLCIFDIRYKMAIVYFPRWLEEHRGIARST